MTPFRSRVLTLTAVLPALGLSSYASEPEILGDLAPGYESFTVRGKQGNLTFVESPMGGTFLATDPVRQSATKLLPRGIDGDVFSLDARTVLFGYNDNRYGNELWCSDGTREGTYLVKDLVEGTQSYGPEQFVHWRGHVYFINQSLGNATPPQLWRTDGTPGGTQFILELPTMFNAEDQTVKWGRVSALAASPDALVFIVNISSHSSGQFETLWRSDGTRAGTYRMSNVNDGTPVFASRFLMTNAGLNFFADNHSDEYAYSLGEWRRGALLRTDGTDQGTATLTEDLAEPSLALFGGNVYGILRDDDSFYLARVNGDATGVEPIATLIPSATVMESIDVKFIVNGADESLMIAISDLSWGGTLNAAWQLSGSPPVVVESDEPYFENNAHTGGSKVIFTGLARGSNPTQFTGLHGGMVLFNSNVGLVSSRGTPASTAPLRASQSTCPNCTFEATASLTALGRLALFSDEQTATLWRSDGTAEGTRIVRPTPGTTNRNALNWIAAQNSTTGLLLTTEPKNVLLNESSYVTTLLRSKGSEQSTSLVKTFEDSFSAQEPPARHLGAVYFSAADGKNGEELWRSDGTAAGTWMVKDIVSGADSSSPRHLTSAGRNLYFTFYGENQSLFLGRTRAGTKEVTRVAAFSQRAPAPSAFTAVKESVYFRLGRDLYRSNGQPGDLQHVGRFDYSVKALYDSEKSDWPAAMTAFKDHLYFIARKGIDDPLQVWRVDCKATQAEVVTPSFEVAAWEAQDVEFYVYADRLFLGIMDRVGANGGIFELKKNGKNVEWYRHTSMPAKSLSISGGKLYFAGLDDQYGEEPRVMPLPQKP